MVLIQDECYRAVMRFGNRIAFDSLDRKITFDQLWTRIDFLSGALLKLGVNKGDRLAILSGNCSDYIVYHYSAARIGAILLVLNMRHTTEELKWALNNAEARILIINELFADQLEILQKNCPSIEQTIGIGSVETAHYSTDELIALHQELINPPKLVETDPILLIYTSGTTGRPKGALQTHEGSVMIDRLTADALEISTRDVYLAFMPYFHQAGLIRTRATLINGGINLVAGKINLESLVSYIVDKKVSITMLVPPYDTLLTEIADRDNLTFPSLRFIIGAGGAGSAHAERMRVFCERFNCNYMGVYGQTEVTGPATLITGKDYFSRPDSCGKPMAGIELEIWDDENNIRPTGEVGEIMIRSRTCVPGYWKNDAASQALYSREWLHTGDLGRVDEEGFVYFIDRKKELIKTGGENVYPREVEDVLRTHPSIAELTVIGLPDEGGWGEKVTAVVILKEGHTLSLQEVKAVCRGKIAGYKIPKSLKIVETIPRNYTGKIRKLLLKEQFKEG